MLLRHCCWCRRGLTLNMTNTAGLSSPVAPAVGTSSVVMWSAAVGFVAVISRRRCRSLLIFLRTQRARCVILVEDSSTCPRWRPGDVDVGRSTTCFPSRGRLDRDAGATTPGPGAAATPGAAAAAAPGAVDGGRRQANFSIASKNWSHHKFDCDLLNYLATRRSQSVVSATSLLLPFPIDAFIGDRFYTLTNDVTCADCWDAIRAISRELEMSLRGLRPATKEKSFPAGVRELLAPCATTRTGRSTNRVWFVAADVGQCSRA